MDIRFDGSEQIGEIVADFPQTADVFSVYGIDFCCGGKRPLGEVIRQRELEEERILKELNEAVQQAEAGHEQATDWKQVPLDFLIHHIVDVHHAYARKELSQLEVYLSKVVKVHGGKHPELHGAKAVFDELKVGLGTHLDKEERILFPLIREDLQEKSPLLLARVQTVLDRMEAEHEEAGDLLLELRKITQDYQLPPDACNTFRVAYEKIKALERDLHQHIHLENNILFQRVKEER